MKHIKSRINKNDDSCKFSLEESMAELDTIAKILENGGAGLEDSVELFERGSKIYAQCRKKLHQLKLKVTKITSDSGGAS